MCRRYDSLLPIGILLGLCQIVAAQPLVVSNGSFGQQLSPGATNHIWALAPGSNVVFDRWVGDAKLLDNPYSWHTTLVMPSNEVSLAATFKASRFWQPETNILNHLSTGDPLAVNLIYYFPTNPAGVIFLFNGARGSAAGFFNEAESLSFMRDAAAAGYGVAALDSGSGPGRSWDTTFSANNIDVMNVQKALNYFATTGLVTTQTARFAAGMSAGGFFAPIPCYFLGFNACALWCSSGAPSSAGTTVFNLTTVPTIWNLARNDDLYNHTAFLNDAANNLALLSARAVPGELRENPPSPVYPRRFARIEGLTDSDSQIIHDQLKSAGLLDNFDYLASNPMANGNQWQSAITGYTSYFPEIQNQLNSCYSEHHFFSDFGNKTLQFFGARRSPIPRGNGIQSIAREGEGLKLTIAADAGQSCRIQYSADLGGWLSIFTNSYPGGNFDFIDPHALERTRGFYRTLSP